MCVTLPMKFLCIGASTCLGLAKYSTSPRKVPRKKQLQTKVHTSPHLCFLKWGNPPLAKSKQTEVVFVWCPFKGTPKRYPQSLKTPPIQPNPPPPAGSDPLTRLRGVGPVQGAGPGMAPRGAPGRVPRLRRRGQASAQRLTRADPVGSRKQGVWTEEKKPGCVLHVFFGWVLYGLGFLIYVLFDGCSTHGVSDSFPPIVVLVTVMLVQPWILPGSPTEGLCFGVSSSGAPPKQLVCTWLPTRVTPEFIPTRKRHTHSVSGWFSLDCEKVGFPFWLLVGCFGHVWLTRRLSSPAGARLPVNAARAIAARLACESEGYQAFRRPHQDATRRKKREV